MIKNRGLGKFLLLSIVFFAVLPLPVLGNPVSLKPEGDILYVAHEEGIIETRDKYSGSLEGKFQKDIDLLNFETDGTNFYVGSSDGKLLVLNPGGQVLEEINVSGSPVSSLVIDKDHSRLYTGSWDNEIRVWDMRDWSLEKVLDEQKLPIKSLVIDGLYLYSGGGDSSVKVWDRQTLAFVKNLTTHTDWQAARKEGYPITKIIVHGGRVYAGHYNGNIRIWDLKTDSIIKEIEDAHSAEVQGLVTDGQYIYSIGTLSEGTVKIWTMEGEPTGVVLATGKSPTSLAVDETQLYVGVYEGGVLVYSKDFWNLVKEIGSFTQKAPEKQQLESLESSGFNPLLPVISIFALFLPLFWRRM
jgi:WD40 repeat protein